MKNTSKKQLGISKTLHFKRSRVVGLLLLLVLSINLSANVNQNLQDRFSLTINNKTLSETLKEITDKSHYIFFFYTGYVDNNKKTRLFINRRDRKRSSSNIRSRIQKST